jgi:hypothetical protein
MLTAKKNKQPKIKPNTLDMPTTEEGVKYTIIFGTCWVENPVVVWWGDVATQAIIKKYKESSLFGSKTTKVTVGYHYSMGAHLILTQGQNDGVKQIRVGDAVVWPTAGDKTALQADGAASAVIDEADLFGGEDQEGGVVGTIDFQYGASGQLANSYLVSKLGANISGTRGLTAAILRQVRFGTSPYPKPWAFLIKRTAMQTNGDTQWYSAKATVNSYDLNPAHILRECYTNTEWGLGHSTFLFDNAVWQPVADQLYAEGFGLSLKWEDQGQTLEDFINEVLRHIDAVIYKDPESGHFVLKLIRDDYVVGDLESFDDSDIGSVDDYTRGAYHKNADTLRLTYWSRLDNEAVTITDHDIALMNSQGGKMVVSEADYYGVMSDALAGKLAARDRRELSAFPAAMKMKTKRTMSHLRPGDVFKLTWPTLGITDMAVRILHINYGTLADGRLTLTCVEDVFALQSALYSAPPASGWTDPRNDPEDVADYMLGETPFLDIVTDMGLSAALALDADSGFLMVAAKAPTSDAYDFEMLLRDSPSSDFYSENRGNFTPCGRLDSFLPKNAQDVEITLLDPNSLLDVEPDTYAVIADEIVKVLSVDAANDKVTIARGCLDTVPEYHPGDDSGGDGAMVWFVGSKCYISGREYAAADQPGVKILTRTDLGQLAVGDATAHNADAFNSRMNRPYPPGDFKVDGASYPASFTGQPTISWAHRDRTQQIGIITEHGDAGIGPEAGMTYTLQIYDENDVLVRTETGLTGTSYTYSWDDELADCGLASGDPLNSSLRFVLKSVRSGIDNWESYDLRVNRA